MGIMVSSLLWVMQGLCHQPYFLSQLRYDVTQYSVDPREVPFIRGKS